MLVQFRYPVMNGKFSAPIEVCKGEALHSIKAKIFAAYCCTWRHAPNNMTWRDASKCITLWKEIKPSVYDDLYAIIEDAVEEQIDTEEKFRTALKTVQFFNVSFRALSQQGIQSRL